MKNQSRVLLYEGLNEVEQFGNLVVGLSSL